MIMIPILIVTLLAAAGANAAQSKIHVEHDAEAFATKISIQATDGRVAWSDVLRGLARARGNDDDALKGVLPDGRFDVTGIGSRLIFTALNLALRPGVNFHVQGAEAPGGEPRLVIELDRSALLASKRRFKARLRNALLRRRTGGGTYGLSFDDDWQRAAADKNLVVLVHGLNSAPEEIQVLHAATRQQGFPCAVFNYPNDQPIADSANLLARQLALLARDHPRRGVSLLTHSMGGLISRAVIEDPRLDPGNVRQLIMVAPPNHGSGLARFGFALEVWQQIRNERRREEVGTFYAWIEDGLSEAAQDLRPDSPFLRKLNARRRNPNVRYTIFLGTGAPLEEHELASLRNGVAEAGGRNRWARFFGARAQQWLGDLDEVVAGKGDGAVSLRRGRLEGVEDTVVLKFSHSGVLHRPQQGDGEEVIEEVLKRLKETDPQP